jgi:hypothetical protein
MMGNYHVRFGKGFLTNGKKVKKLAGVNLLFHNDNCRLERQEKKLLNARKLIK